MKALIAEDDAVSRHLLETLLRRWDFEVVVASEGNEAWRQLRQPDPPRLAILDWMMPGMDGLTLCRKIRQIALSEPLYIVLVTARARTQDIIRGLEAGADDYVAKPFDPEELRARIDVGVRMLNLHMELATRVQELSDALQRVKRLQGLLPICSYCKRIRNDQDYWRQVEDYISEHTEVTFSHGICPDCYEKLAKPMLKGSRPQKRRVQENVDRANNATSDEHESQTD